MPKVPRDGRRALSVQVLAVFLLMLKLGGRDLTDDIRPTVRVRSGGGLALAPGADV